MKRNMKNVLCALMLTCGSIASTAGCAAEEYTAETGAVHYGTVSEDLEIICGNARQTYLTYGDMCISEEITIWNVEDYIQQVDEIMTVFREYQAENAAEQEYKDTTRHQLRRIANELQLFSMEDAAFSNLGDILSGNYLGAILGASDDVPGLKLVSVDLGNFGT